MEDDEVAADHGPDVNRRLSSGHDEPQTDDPSVLGRDVSGVGRQLAHRPNASPPDRAGGPGVDFGRSIAERGDDADGRSDAEQLELFPASVTRSRLSYSYHGPLPSPDMLARYADAGSDFPERIVRMAEKSVDATIENERRESEAAEYAVKSGLVVVLLVTFLSLIFAFVLALVGVSHWWAALVLPAVSAVPRIISATKGTAEPGDQAK